MEKSEVLTGIVEEFKTRWNELRNTQNVYKAQLFELREKAEAVKAQINQTEIALTEMQGRYKEVTQWIERFTGDFPGVQAAKSEMTPADPRKEIKNAEQKAKNEEPSKK